MDPLKQYSSVENTIIYFKYLIHFFGYGESSYYLK